MDSSDLRSAVRARDWLIPALALLGFVVLTQQVLTLGPLTRADEPVHELITREHSVVLDVLLTIVSAVAQFPVSAPILFAYAVFRSVRRSSWAPVLTCGLPLLLLSATTLAAKLLIGRAGTDQTPDTLHVGGTAYPSGHAATAVVVSTLFVVLLALENRKRALAAAGGWSALVGFARIYVDAHWVSDVAGGLLLGLAIAGTTLVVLRRPTESDSRSPLL
ncbi:MULTISPECIES: phosphatase PAP2 family protein [Actinomycetes]|uniref:phosphatase PAP2 family protein n=1 Tax=Actinomycetes TaxID=1760 RepID=UPI00131A3936|nr:MULTISPECIES: phosphatase PAP2 family protein [Actinomycetes]